MKRPVRMYCVCGAPATGLRHYSVALRMGDSDEHIEVNTTPEGKILQSYNSGKCEPKVVFEKLTAIITKKTRHGVDCSASLWRRKCQAIDLVEVPALRGLSESLER